MAVKTLARRLAAAVFVCSTVAAPACGPAMDVAAALRLESVTTGWVDVGPVGRNTKLVPMVSFKVKNTTDRTLAPVQVNAVFRRVGDASDWTNGMVVAAGSSGLAPAAATDRLLIKGEVGYTGADPQWDLLKNSHFVDAKVDV